MSTAQSDQRSGLDVRAASGRGHAPAWIARRSRAQGSRATGFACVALALSLHAALALAARGVAVVERRQPALTPAGPATVEVSLESTDERSDERPPAVRADQLSGARAAPVSAASDRPAARPRPPRLLERRRGAQESPARAAVRPQPRHASALQPAARPLAKARPTPRATGLRPRLAPPERASPEEHGASGASAEEALVAVFKPRPEYPRRALLGGLEGVVTLEFVVTSEGRVREPRVVSASPPGVFDEAARRALLRWTFKPKLSNGRAVSRRARLDVNFELKR